MLTDLRFALRQLAKSPGFTAIALLTLALGIGSATVVFSAINAFLFKPLPHIAVPEERLVYATQTETLRGNLDAGWNYTDYLAIRARSQTLAGLWIHADFTVILSGGDAAQRLRGTQISPEAFDLMGVRPLHGRNFTPADAEAGAPAVALLSHGVWASRFGADPAVVGKDATLNGQLVTIVGIMPPGWRYPEVSDAWFPLRVDPTKTTYRGYFPYSGRALLKPGVTLAQAQAELDALFAALAAEFPATNAHVGAHLRPIREEAVEDTRQFTLLLFGAVTFVFLIACVNVANLLLARAVTRSKEVAIRLALGAPRRRVVRQLVTESLVLSLAGGVCGLVAGLWGNDAVVAAIPVEIPFWLRFEFDYVVFGFVFALSVVAALAFGLMPALKASRPDLLSELKEGGRSNEISGPRATRLRNALVVLEIALALVLLVGAGLTMRSFLELRRLDPGFDPRQVLTFRTGWPHDMARAEPEAPPRFFAELGARLAVLPGVESVAFTNWIPGRGNDAYLATFYAAARGRPGRPADATSSYRRSVTPNYFATLRIPLKAGRTFDDTLDQRKSAPVLVVDEAFAVRHFGSPEGALGQRVSEYEEFPKPDAPVHSAEIIGVVGNIRHNLDRPDNYPTLYTSHLQWPELFRSVVIRTRGEPSAFAAAARETVVAVNRDIPIYELLTLEDVLLRSDTVWPRRFFGFLFTLFGGVALFLACIGIYGVMSYNVTQRTQELGVRVALGAQPGEIIQLIVRHGLRLVGVGLALGLAASLALAQLLSGLLFGISPHDPPTFALVPLLLASVALLACWLSSRRATLITPQVALRSH
jgi:putative ABC transport system permease protein